MNKKVMICGDFFGIGVTGIQRVALEIIQELDKLIEPNEICLAVPENVGDIPPFRNLKIVRLHSADQKRHLWIQWWYAIYTKKNRYLTLSFGNEIPMLNPGIGYIHDLYYLLYPQDFKDLKNKIMSIVLKILYKFSVKHAKKVITITDAVKNEICTYYNADENRIAVVGNGWQHIKVKTPDFAILQKHNLNQGEFFFTLGSMEVRKNVQWIFKYAKEHPNDIFVLSGKMKESHAFFEAAKQMKNVILLGYVSDEEMAALIKTCKAFIFPSRYEGFGIPPLEAMALGVKSIVVSDIPVLREIYEDAVHYLNPNDINVDLNQLVKEPLKMTYESILNKYSWKKSAEELLEIIRAI